MCVQEASPSHRVDYRVLNTLPVWCAMELTEDDLQLDCRNGHLNCVTAARAGDGWPCMVGQPFTFLLPQFFTHQTKRNGRED